VTLNAELEQRSELRPSRKPQADASRPSPRKGGNSLPLSELKANAEKARN
jgi:hypothetical protein